MSEALKPCDFCGFADFGTQHFQVDDSNRWGWVICGECEARGPSVRVAAAIARPVPWQDDARDTWNRRTPSPAVRALVEAVDVLNRNKIQWLTCPSDWDAVREALAAVEREIGEA